MTFRRTNSWVLSGLRKSLKQNIIWFILPILTHLSEFERFFKNSKNRKVQVSCAITFDGIVMDLKVIVAFKLQKFMFLTSKIEALSDPSKNMIFCALKTTITFKGIAMPPKIMAHNTWTFLFWKFLKNCLNSLIEAKMSRIK